MKILNIIYKDQILESLIDDKDYLEAIKYKWSITSGYVARHNKLTGRTHYLHRQIMNFPVGKDVDHINRKKLDNRRINLRAVSHADNMINNDIRSNNTSGFPGVCWDKSVNCWKAAFRGKYVGSAKSADEAYSFYKIARTKALETLNVN